MTGIPTVPLPRHPGGFSLHRQPLGQVPVLRRLHERLTRPRPCSVLRYSDAGLGYRPTTRNTAAGARQRLSDLLNWACATQTRGQRSDSGEVTWRTPLTDWAMEMAAPCSRSEPFPVTRTTPSVTCTYQACRPVSASTWVISSAISVSERAMARITSLRVTTPRSTSPWTTGTLFQDVVANV